MLVGVLWSLPVMMAGVTERGYLAGTVKAEEKKRETRRVPALREQTYKKIAEASLMIDPESAPREEGEPAPEPKGTPQDAIDMLRELVERRGLNSFERAQIWNVLAFGYYTIGDIKGTINSYEQVLAQGTITESLEQSVIRALYQLYFGEEQYRRAIEYMERYEALTETQDPGLTFIKSTAYYQLKEYRNSLENALLTEQIAVAQGKEVKENWWYLQVVLYSELKDYDNVIRVLETLLVHYPKREYWMHLAAMYSEKGWEDKSLSAYHAAYTQEMLTKESELVMLSQRLLNSDVPYEAALVLEKGFKEDVIEANEKNLKLLATCYTMSQEYSKAIDAWRDATKFDEDGETFFRLAQALSRQDRHREAVKAYQSAVDNDNKNPSDVYFWMGISLMNLEDWDNATVAFRQAQKDKDKEKTVRQYIRYITGEKRRQEELKKMLEAE
jgi:tetratricopeptide (TPR) repeat protein